MSTRHTAKHSQHTAKHTAKHTRKATKDTKATKAKKVLRFRLDGVDRRDIALIIGKGGKNVRSMARRYGHGLYIKHDNDDLGSFTLESFNSTALVQAKTDIERTWHRMQIFPDEEPRPKKPTRAVEAVAEDTSSGSFSVLESDSDGDGGEGEEDEAVDFPEFNAVNKPKKPTASIEQPTVSQGIDWGDDKLVTAGIPGRDTWQKLPPSSSWASDDDSDED